MINTMTNLVGGGDIWSPKPDGTTNIQELSESDTEVVFEDVPADDDFGYVVWIFSDTATDPTVEPPKQIGDLEFDTPVGGKTTVTCNLTTVTAAQDGTTCKLRIIR